MAVGKKPLSISKYTRVGGKLVYTAAGTRNMIGFDHICVG